MQTSFLYSSKATALTLALMSLLFSFLFMPAQQAEAVSYSGESNGSLLALSGYRSSSGPSLEQSTGSPNSPHMSATGAGRSAVTPQSSDTSLQARLDAALKQIAELQARIAASGKGTLYKNPDTKVQCAAFTRTFRRGATDATTGGEVTRLQTYLAKDSALYPEGSVTGFYGPATERAVQRFQSKSGIVKSGNAYTTGFGSIGGETRMALGKICSNKDTSTVSTSTKSYTLEDVKSVTAKKVDPIPRAIDDEYTFYTITLKNGTIYEVKRGFAGPGVFEKALKATGYTGDVRALLALATEPSSLVMCKSGTEKYPEGTKRRSIVLENGSTSVINDAYYLCVNGTWTISSGTTTAKAKQYSLDSVKLVTASIKQSSDPVTTYIVTLKDGSTRTIAVAGNMTASMYEEAFRDSGYTGVVASLIAKVGTVLGAETSSVDVLLDEIFERLDALSLLIE